MLSSGCRDFRDYNARRQGLNSDPVQILSYHDLSRGLLDSDTDSDNEFSDAQSQLEDQQALALGYSRNQLYFLNPKPGDHLHRAFELAVECKSLLNKHNTDMAVAAFVKACTLSTFSLSLFSPETEECTRLLQEVENSSFARHSHILHSRPVFMAARCILVGFGYLDLPKAFDLSLSSLPFQSFFALPANLTQEDVAWVAHMGRFRAHLSSLKEPEPAMKADAGYNVGSLSLQRSSHSNALLLKTARLDLEVMQSSRPSHPLTIQAASQLARYQGRDEPSSRVIDGYNCAMREFADPAQAVQHLLHCMYSELLGCYGRPTPEVQRRLQHAADKVLHSVNTLQQYPFNDSSEISLWDLTKDKLLAAMFMLARVFPLQEALDRHPLATFIEEQHHEWRHQLPGSNRVWQYFSMDQTVSPENSSFSVDAKLTDDDNTAMQHCGRCNRRRKETEMFICDKCRSTWYCSSDCLSRDAQVHKHSCIRVQLKKKMQSQKSRKGQGSPTKG